jgi:hypothetical protein
MITLYHSPLLRSVRIVPYRLEILAFTSSKTPDWLKVRPALQKALGREGPS